VVGPLGGGDISGVDADRVDESDGKGGGAADEAKPEVFIPPEIWREILGHAYRKRNRQSSKVKSQWRFKYERRTRFGDHVVSSVAYDTYEWEYEQARQTLVKENSNLEPPYYTKILDSWRVDTYEVRQPFEEKWRTKSVYVRGKRQKCI